MQGAFFVLLEAELIRLFPDREVGQLQAYLDKRRLFLPGSSYGALLQSYRVTLPESREKRCLPPNLIFLPILIQQVCVH